MKEPLALRPIDPEAGFVTRIAVSASFSGSVSLIKTPKPLTLRLVLKAVV
jgi:hypothetical protein